MNEKIVGKDGAIRSAQKDWQVAKQLAEQADHQRLVDSLRVTGLPPKALNKGRTPLYPSTPAVSRRIELKQPTQCEEGFDGSGI